MITLTRLRDAWCVYRVDWLHPANPRNPFYIGACPLDSITKLADARRNSEFAQHVGKDEPLGVTIIAVIHDAESALQLQSACVGTDRPHCNLNGTQADAIKAGKRVQCIDTGEIYASVKEAAAEYQVTRQAFSMHLNGKQHTIAGHRFKYIA